MSVIDWLWQADSLLSWIIFQVFVQFDNEKDKTLNTFIYIGSCHKRQNTIVLVKVGEWKWEMGFYFFQVQQLKMNNT